MMGKWLWELARWYYLRYADRYDREHGAEWK